MIIFSNVTGHLDIILFLLVIVPNHYNILFGYMTGVNDAVLWKLFNIFENISIILL